MRFAWLLVAAAGCRFDLPDEASDAAPRDAPPGQRTAAVPLALCTGGLPGDPTCPINMISLDDLGVGGIPGAKIMLTVAKVGAGSYFNELRLVPGPAGAYIEHPLFVSIPIDSMQDGIPDPLDRFVNTKMSVSATATTEQQKLGGGTAAFSTFPSSNRLAIFFKVAKTL